MILNMYRRFTFYDFLGGRYWYKGTVVLLSTHTSDLMYLNIKYLNIKYLNISSPSIQYGFKELPIFHTLL